MAHPAGLQLLGARPGRAAAGVAGGGIDGPGNVLPLVKVNDDLSLPGNSYRISVAGAILGDDQVWPNDLLALDSGDCLEGITGRPCKDPSFGLDALWIEPHRRADAIAAGYTVVDAATVVATHLNRIVAVGRKLVNYEIG